MIYGPTHSQITGPALAPQVCKHSKKRTHFRVARRRGTKKHVQIYCITTFFERYSAGCMGRSRRSALISVSKFPVPLSFLTHERTYRSRHITVFETLWRFVLVTSEIHFLRSAITPCFSATVPVQAASEFKHIAIWSTLSKEAYAHTQIRLDDFWGIFLQTSMNQAFEDASWY